MADQSIGWSHVYRTVDRVGDTRAGMYIQPVLLYNMFLSLFVNLDVTLNSPGLFR